MRRNCPAFALRSLPPAARAAVGRPGFPALSEQGAGTQGANGAAAEASHWRAKRLARIDALCCCIALRVFRHHHLPSRARGQHMAPPPAPTSRGLAGGREAYTHICYIHAVVAKWGSTAVPPPVLRGRTVAQKSD